METTKDEIITLKSGYVRVNIRVAIDTRKPSKCKTFVYKVRVGDHISYSAVMVSTGQFLPVTFNEGFDVGVGDNITVSALCAQLIDLRKFFSMMEIEWRAYG